MNLDALWNYMQLDLEADKFGNDMRQSPKRQTLLKQRNFLKDQQTNMTKIETEVGNMNTRMEAIQEEVGRLSALLEEQQAQLESNPPSTVDEVKVRSAAISKLVDSLSKYEQELTKMHKDAENRDRQQRDIRVSAAKTKANYDKVKAEYDKEFAEDSKKLKELRAKADEAEAKLDAADVEKYKAVKQHVTPPMAMMVNDQCGGCFMSLPLGIVRDMRSTQRVVTCDNCGRILYVKE